MAPLLLSLEILPFRSVMLLAGLKVIGQGLISGTLFSFVFLFSVCGTAASVLLMSGLARLLKPSLVSAVGLGIAGALASNAAQLIAAGTLVFGQAAWYIVPPFLALGLVSGTGLGVVCEYIKGHSQWYQHLALKKMPSEVSAASPVVLSRPGGQAIQAWKAFLALSALFALLFCPWTLGQLALFLLFWLIISIKGIKQHPLSTLLVFGSVVLMNLLAPYGKVLLKLGPLEITLGALDNGLSRAATLEGLLMLSRLALRGPLPQLPGRFGALLSETLRRSALLNEQIEGINRKHILRGLDEILSQPVFL
jgi:heptaprenyl diphosphate synthase